MAVQTATWLSLFSLAYDSITHRKLRAFLTMLGIFVGVASVVALISLGQGLSDSVNRQFQKIGTDKLLIMPGGGAGPMAFFASKLLTEHDLDAVRRVRGVQKVGYMITRSTQVRANDKAVFAQVVGIPISREDSGVVEELRSLEPFEGRLLGPNDNQKALIGYHLARENVFGRDLKLNDMVQINGTLFRIVGILQKKGDPFVDSGIFIPISEAQDHLAGGVREFNGIAVKLEPGLVPAEQVEEFEKALRRSRGVKKGKEDFRVQTTEQLISSFNSIFGLVQAIVIGIAAISLLVGGIGIMNTMYTSVLERTQEIGVMKAIGARNNEILVLFLIESGLLGAVGGVVGVLLGYAMAKIGEMVANTALGTGLLVVYFPPQLVIGVFLFSLVLGCISGAFPALQAAKLRPVDALRYE